jgi:hypothetical protein
MTAAGVPTHPRNEQNPENDAGDAQNGAQKTAIAC